MADYVNILKEQVEEGRRSGLSSSHGSTSTRQSIQKKKLIPLDNPELNQPDVKPQKNPQKKTNSRPTSAKKEPQKLNKPIYKEVSTEPEQISQKNRPQLSTMSTDPMPTDITENNQEDVAQDPPKGGALWDAPKDLQDIRSSMKSLPQKQPPPENKPSFFDMVMQPPKKELQPTLFTYFDKLMQMGEV